MSYTNGLDKPSDYFTTKIHTGTGATHNITGLDFAPDFVWLKSRTQGGTGYNGMHYLFDTIRGATKRLRSNDTSAEATSSASLTAFNSDGYTLGTDEIVNKSGDAYVGWSWLGGGTASSNTDGSITSNVSANTTSGFSIVTYSGNSTAGATVGHGLNQALDMLIIKDRTNNAGNTNWNVYHSANTSAPETEVIALNDTSATSDSNIYWNDTAPTSSVFTLGSAGQVNYNTDDYVAYCFHSVKGFSKFGSYTGNGSADGTFIYTGFKPAWVMIKRTDSAQQWGIMDNKRNTFNPMNAPLFAESTQAESSSAFNNFDILSNGMKMKTGDQWTNASGGSYIYMALAENPFVTSTGIPTTAR